MTRSANVEEADAEPQSYARITKPVASYEAVKRSCINPRGSKLCLTFSELTRGRMLLYNRVSVLLLFPVSFGNQQPALAKFSFQSATRRDFLHG
ncbi:hypothetical protein KM043_010719 [Ampulex compressa]|nr:hypothetical protein KM043_010719 [Ampulex compressa]